MGDHIHIHNCTLLARVGCCDFEQLMDQPLSFSLWLWSDLKPAGLSDDLSDTINYAQVIEALQHCCEQQHHATLEALAHRCSQHVLSHFPCSALRLQICKPHAVHVAQAVCVDITRERSDVL